MSAESRWPPAYDFQDLANQIKSIVRRGALEKEFYSLRGTPPGRFFQGDILSLRARFPFLTSSGEPAAQHQVVEWLLLSNSCYLSREATGHIQLLPVVNLGARASFSDAEYRKYRSFKDYNAFYLPPWDLTCAEEIKLADFRRPVTAEIGILDQAGIIARMERPAWALFNACLVRHYARDDGRNDP